jgi:gliding motility-associated-like protein
LIIPNDLNDDYDWQLFDITGKNPNDVYTNPALFVACNWSGRTGITGASAAGVGLANCITEGNNNPPIFSAQPNLIIGHEYLLLISHFTVFTPSQNGYKLVFGGGTALITDPKIPGVDNAVSFCGGKRITVKLNKKMKCASIAPDGSDFQLNDPLTTILQAEGYNCNSSFETDSVTLTLSNSIAPGNYTVTLRRGADGNTVLDNCENEITPGTAIAFIVNPIAPSLIDSVRKLNCSPQSIVVELKDPVLCSSIASNGSDFFITGPQAVVINAASGNCTNTTLTKTITLQLSGPIQTGGTYNLEIRTGSDGNSLQTECGLETPVGNGVQFLAADTVNANFTFITKYGCKQDTVEAIHPGQNGVNRWQWYNGNQPAGTAISQTFLYNVFGNKSIGLKVSNGVCSDSAGAAIVLDNTLDAAFVAPATLCPEDMATMEDKSIGKIQSWYWDFGDGTSSNIKNPLPHTFPAPTASREAFYTVRLRVTDIYNCSDSATERVKVVSTCRIGVPNAFTPNGDGKNDYLYPLNAYKATELQFSIYNRYGQLVFETKDWTRKWDGTLRSVQQPSGTYVWTLSYFDTEKKERVFRKGTTILIR